jgi:hypothetical protein
MASHDPIAEAYIRLALSIDHHVPGCVDAYYGPEDWRIQAEADGPRPISGSSKKQRPWLYLWKMTGKWMLSVKIISTKKWAPCKPSCACNWEMS